MKRLPFILFILCGFLTIALLSSCQRVDAQTLSQESRKEYSAERPVGPDGNPATYDENPENLPQSVVRTYVNTDGVEVQSPTAYKAPPPGSCAICRDGTYSQSKHRTGTCSRHGGVKEWLKDLP